MPLRGIRVLDWSIYMQGPLACEILGAFGAEVIKIEHPVMGDPSRGSIKQNGVPQVLPDGRTATNEGHNRNKKGIGVDLKTAQGKKIAYRLVQKSDVFVHNQRGSVAERLGLDYKSLSAVNPNLIYAQGWGLGPKGPDRDLPVLDSIAQARSGLMLYGADSASSPNTAPIEPILAVADEMAATNLAFGVVMALLARNRLGVSQRVDASLLGGGMRIIRQQIAGFYLTDIVTPRCERESTPNPLYSHYRCKDGRWIRLGLFQSERYWSNFCRVIDRSALEHDPRFLGANNRQQNSDQLVAILDDVFATRTYSEWDLRFHETDLLFGPVQSIPDLCHDPQVIENRYLVDFHDPVVGPIKVPGMAFDLSETPWAVRSPAPMLGQNTEEVLTELLGYTWEEVVELKEQGVIV